MRVVIRNGTIYDRAHGLILRAPAGWIPTASEGMLFGMTPRNRRSNEAFIAQEIEVRELTGADVPSAIRAKFQQMGLQYAGSRQANTASGQRFVVDVWSGQTNSGPVGVETTQFPHGDHVAVFMFLSPSLQQNRSPLGELLQQAVIDVNRARSAEPPRMRVAPARAGESWSDLARRATGNANDAEAIANINGFDLTTPPKAGMLVKLPQEVIPEGS
jgi:predicted Zn-dependent protease